MRSTKVQEMCHSGGVSTERADYSGAAGRNHSLPVNADKRNGQIAASSAEVCTGYASVYSTV